jgi:hypothetical protein
MYGRLLRAFQIQTIANPTVRPLVNTTYYVTGTDVNGCFATDSVRVYFLDPSLNLIVEDIQPICIKRYHLAYYLRTRGG